MRERHWQFVCCATQRGTSHAGSQFLAAPKRCTVQGSSQVLGLGNFYPKLMAPATALRSAKNRLRAARPRIWSHNVQGLVREDKLLELFQVVEKRKAFAVCVQETWRKGKGKEQMGLGGTVGIFAADETKAVKGRGSRGVGILLSAAAKVALDKATSHGKAVHNDLGERVCAVRLLVENERAEEKGIFLVSAYAPIGAASQEDWEEFFDKVTQCISRKLPGDMLVMGIDANSSMGIGDGLGACGLFGNSHQNDSGKRFKDFLALRDLVSTATFFRKKKYDTWFNPARRGEGYQLDHLITERKDLACVTDSGVKGLSLVDSDHRPLCCTVRLRVPLKKKKKASERDNVVKRDFSVLTQKDEEGDEARAEFCRNVVKGIDKGK